VASGGRWQQYPARCTALRLADRSRSWGAPGCFRPQSITRIKQQRLETIAMYRGTTAIVLLAISQLACGSGERPPGVPDSSLPTPDAASPDEPRPVDAPPVDLGSDGGGPVAYTAWPAEAAVAMASAKDAFGANLSGLVYEPATATTPAVLWAVQNEPSKLYRLVASGSAYTPATTEGWITGKVLRYPGGAGSPDTEGLCRTDWSSDEIYVVAERDNEAKDVSRQSILRYEIVGSKGVLDATHEWVLTSDLPPADVNCGLEGIAWLPDSHLVERGFFDESTQAPYDPTRYPNHGSGIFLVGYDETGMIYGYVLDHQAGTFTRVATLSSGQARSVDLTFDRDVGTLWSLCDSPCDGRMTLLDIDPDPVSITAGRFVLRATVPPPKALANMNNEGIALAPLSECSGERRAFFWADDEESGGYAIRRGSITCGRLY
jgi:hypothetical protein